jgi:membrane protein
MSSITKDRAEEHGRGRHADSPAKVPAKGWKDIVLRTFKEIGNDRITLISAGVTYYLLLAMFPAITAFVSVYGLFADRSTIAEHMAVLSTVVPSGGLDILNGQLQRLTAEDAPTLGFALIISLGLALWSASSGVKSMFEAMNVAYDEVEKRNFFVLNAVALLFTLGGVVGALVMLAVVVALPAVLSIVGFGEGFEWLVQIAGYVVMVLVLITGIAALYRWGPSRQQAKWRWITPGATFAVVVIMVVSLLFSWYASNFAHFDKTYGSLGALIGFLTWMWLSITAVAAGAELNSEAEHQTAKDSTTGADSPMGTRDASMADTLGEASGKGGDGSDDPRVGKSKDWVEGFEAGRRHWAGSRRRLPRGWAIPAAIALNAMEKRREKQG